MAIRILSSENISGEVLIASGKYLSWGTAGATSIEGSTVSNKLQFRTNSTNAVIIDSSQNVGIGNFTNPNDGNLVVKKDGLNTGIPNSLTNASFSEGGGQLKGLTIGYRTDETTAVIAARTATGDIAFMGYDGGWLETARFTNDNRLGIGTDSPDGKVHIFNGSNGATTVGTASDELILENDTDCGLTIRSAADGTGVVSFASPTDHNVGQLYYNHDDDSMVIRTNDAIRTIIGSSGIMYIMGATASTNNSLQLQYNSTAGTAEIYSKSTGGNTTFEFYTSSSGTTTQKFNIGSSGDVKITTNGKFLQGVRNTSGTVIDMIGFGAGTDRLQIKGGTSGGSESIAFFDTAGQMATFYNSNFGIGVTSPSGKLEVAGGNTLGFRLSNLGNQSAYDQVRMTYTGYNSGSPTVTFMPLTTPGGGNVDTTFHFSNSNGLAANNNRANVNIDGILNVGSGRQSGETTLIMRNYDASLVDSNEIQNSIRMSGRYWSGSASQLVETRINSVHQESNGNGGSALTFMTQTGGSAVTEKMRIDKSGNVLIGTTGLVSSYDANAICKDSAGGYALIVKNSNTSTTNNTVMQLNRVETTATTGGYALIYRQGNASTGTNRLIIFANGNVQNTNNSYGALSDERKKENIVDATPKLDDLMKVKVRNFNLKGEETKQIGVVAQELEEVFPSMIDESKDPDSNDETLYKSVKYSVFVPMLIKSIQELKAEIELLKNK